LDRLPRLNHRGAVMWEAVFLSGGADQRVSGVTGAGKTRILRGTRNHSHVLSEIS
jgi:hypothetical protein